MVSGKIYQYLLFDLDGTVTDSQEGILNSVRYSLSYFKMEIPDQKTLKKFIGPPLSKSLMDYYGFDAGKAAKAVQVYREYFSKKGIYENKLYPGIRDLLKKLNSKGKTIILATAKPTYYAEKIIRYFEIDPFFKEIVGSNMDGTRMEKKEIIRHILDLHPNEPIRQFIMIGDRVHDIEGANFHGIDSIWVQYGYGDEEEITNVTPTYNAERIEDLYELLLMQG
jgi:phosphoglycolate phosphatase